MVDASFVQTAFFGGEWSEVAQGRMDLPQYKVGMNLCTNYYPVESGALYRRQGFRFLHHTRRGEAAKLRAFDFTVTQPYQLEFTDAKLRFTAGLAFVHPVDGELPIVSISSATPAVVTVGKDLPSDWATGDDIIIDIAQLPCTAPTLTGRQFTITKISSTTFSIADALTQVAINGATDPYVFDGAFIDFAKKVFELSTVYVGTDWQNTEVVQDDTSVLLLNKGYEPQLVTVEDPAFAIAAQSLLDGPYFDMNTTTTTLTPSGVSGSVTLTASAITGINDGLGFQITDIGRLVRLKGQPPNWSGATTYAQGETVTGSDSNVYQSIAGSNLNNDPISTEAFWILSPTGIVWTWGEITAFTSTTVVTLNLLGDALLAASATTDWRLGVYSDTTGWPTNGAYHEDRLWLSGAVPNRIDGSKTGDSFNFAPTASDGTAANDNAVSATADATDANSIFWMRSKDEGLFCGTQAGTWRVRAAATDDPISPTSIQMRRVTKIGAANIEPVETPRHILFTQRHKRKVMEFGFSTEQGGYNAPNLNKLADHVTVGGLEEIRFQHEPTPIVWGRLADGTLIGCSYKNDGKPDDYVAWHTHTHGGSYTFTSISTGPSYDGLSETLHAITKDSNDVHQVEALTPIFDDAILDGQAWFTDGAGTPTCATLTGGTPKTGVTIYGLLHLAGLEVCVMIGGLDLGDHTVAADGSIALLFVTDNAAFTEAFLSAQSGSGFGVYGTGYEAASTSVAVASPESAITIRAWKGDTSGDITDSVDFLAPWDNAADIVYTMAAGNEGARAGVRHFRLTGDGEEQLATGIAAIFGASSGKYLDEGLGGSYFFLGYGTDKGGEGALFVQGQIENSPEYYKLNGTTHVLEATYGSGHGTGTGPADATRAVACATADIMGFYAGNGDLIEIIIQSGGTLEDEVTFMNAANMQWLGYNFVPDEPLFRMTGRRTTPQVGADVRYGIGTQKDSTYSAGLNATAIGVYRAVITDGVQNSGYNPLSQANILMTKIGTFLATDIDATWTSGFRGIHGCLLDQRDGNIIFWINTTQAVSVQEYLVKMNPETLAVIWAVEPSSSMNPLQGDKEFRSSICDNSTYINYQGGSDDVFMVFDTTDGSESTPVSFSGVTQAFGQASDDKTLSVHLGMSYSDSGVPAPTVLGTYMPSVNNTFATENGQLWAGEDSTIVPTEVTYTVPTSVGFCYTSQAQILRPDSGQDAGLRNGPAFGKIRRIDQYAVSLYRSFGLEFGVGFNSIDLFAANLITTGNVAVVEPTLFSGIHWDTLEADADFENMICWQQTRPYPGIISAVAGFIGSQDK